MSASQGQRIGGSFLIVMLAESIKVRVIGNYCEINSGFVQMAKDLTFPK